MGGFLEQLQFGGATAVDVLSNLSLSLVLGLLTAAVYRKTHGGFSYSRGFVVTLVSVTMTLTLIMMVIGNYIALSLGLVGALSVVRFRSAIKDPRDIGYLFLVIAIGLACSTGNYALSIVGSLFINATLLILHYLRFGMAQGDEGCLSFVLDEGQHTLAEIEGYLREAGLKAALRSYTQDEGRAAHLVYAVTPFTSSNTQHLQGLTVHFAGVRGVSLLSPEAGMEP